MMPTIDDALERLKDYVESADFAGYDPYDALNSPVLRSLSFNRKWLRIAFIQALKSSPLNIRPLLGIRKGWNPKGIGLFLWGYAKLFSLHPPASVRPWIDRLIDILENTKIPGYSGPCWGYNFDWQSRAFFLPRNTPTVVNTSFVGHALLDAHITASSSRALELALPIKDFILKDINRSEENGSICLSYSPLDRTMIHNANLLGCSLLYRLSRISGEKEPEETAKAGLAYALKHQRDDGSWYYAESSYQNWIDSFHTGFNLQSLLYFLDEGESGPMASAFRKGLEFYMKNFFLEDGTPKYYHDRIYPVDIHSAAQAVVVFSRAGSATMSLARKITEWMIDNLMDDRGYFYFRKTKTGINRIPYIRWSQAWAFHALTDLLFGERAGRDEALSKT